MGNKYAFSVERMWGRDKKTFVGSPMPLVEPLAPSSTQPRGMLHRGGRQIVDCHVSELVLTWSPSRPILNCKLVEDGGSTGDMGIVIVERNRM